MANKLHVYTGDGKGKTTAAMGLALRSLGHGPTVLVAQFMKTGNSGELRALRDMKGAVVMTAEPIQGFTFSMNDDQKKLTKAQQTAFAEEVIVAIGRYKPKTIILDEVGIALTSGMLDDDTALKLIDAALESGETVVTGRRVPKWLEDKADYLSRIAAEKHPYQTEKLQARENVEW